MKISPRVSLVLIGASALLLVAGQWYLRRLDRQTQDPAFAPDETRKLLERGQARQEAGDEEAALKLFEEALTQAPQSADAHYAVGLSLNRLKRYEQARPHLETAVAGKPSFEARLQLAVCLAGLGEEAQAKRRFQDLVHEFPAHRALIRGYEKTMFPTPPQPPP